MNLKIEKKQHSHEKKNIEKSSKRQQQDSWKRIISEYIGIDTNHILNERNKEKNQIII